ncbi:hypothetical protein RFI_35160, partial [Reticulomyxa filosa]
MQSKENKAKSFSYLLLKRNIQSFNEEKKWSHLFAKQTMKAKYFVIETYGTENVIFKPEQLKSDGRMSEGSKEENWEQLLQMTKDQLKLTSTSTFLFIKKDNPDDQIDNDGDLMDSVFFLPVSKKKKKKTMCKYTLKKKCKRCLVITKEDEQLTWCPKNSNDPNFRHELDKQDWDEHFEDLKQAIGVGDNFKSLKESEKRIIQSGEDLKAVWIERYDEDKPWLQLKVLNQTTSKENETDQPKREMSRNYEYSGNKSAQSTTNAESEGDDSPEVRYQLQSAVQDMRGTQGLNNTDKGDDEKIYNESPQRHRVTQSANSMIVQENGYFNIKEMLELVEKAEEAAMEIKDKNVILFLGSTGTGKSTLIHFLAGSTMEKQIVDGKPHIAPVNVKDALITVKTSPYAKSETRYIAAVPIDLKARGVIGGSDTIVLCDTPGFEDTNGPEVDVANGVGIVKALQNCKSVKPVILMSYIALGNRMSCVKDLARTLVGIISSIEDHLCAFSYVFTKFPEDQKQYIHAFTKDTCDSIPKDEADEGYKAILTDIAKQTRKNVIAPDLLQDSSIELFESFINTKNFIKNPKEVFQPFLTEKSSAAVRLQVEKHKSDIILAFQHDNYQIAQIKLNELQALNNVLKNDSIESEYNDCAKKLTQQWNGKIEQAKSVFNKSIVAPHAISREDVLAYKKTIDELKSADPLRSHLKDAISADALVQNLNDQTHHLINEIEKSMENEIALKVHLDKLAQVKNVFPNFASAYKQACQTLAKLLTNSVNNAKECIEKNNLEAVVRVLPLQSNLATLFDVKKEIQHLEILLMTHLNSVVNKGIVVTKRAVKDESDSKKQENDDNSSSVRVSKLTKSDIELLETNVTILEIAMN